MASANLTAKYARECLDYDPETGIFTWKMRPREHFGRECTWKIWNSKYAKTQAGSIDSRGYLQVKIQYRLHLSHRLAFLFVTGAFPPDEVDHINRNRLDNRWSNLRLATHQENGKNQKRHKNNTSGYSGVNWHSRQQKWSARIGKDSKRIDLGSWSSREMAALVRHYSETYYGFDPTHGRG